MRVLTFLAMTALITPNTCLTGTEAQKANSEPVINTVTDVVYNVSAELTDANLNNNTENDLLADYACNASSECSSCCGCGPRWTVQAGTIFLQRSQPNNAVLVTDSFFPGGTVLVDAAQFDFDVQVGAEASVVRHDVFGTRWGVEGRCFGVDSWNTAVGPIASPGGGVVQYATPIGNVAFPANLSASYDSELQSVELNARRQVGGWLQLIAGFRYVEVDERGLTLLQDIGPGLNLATAANGAVNHLWGFQIGADTVLWSRNRLDVEGIIKAGIFGNHAQNSAVLTQTVVPGAFSSTADTGHTSFVGELGLSALYRFTERLSVRATYQMLWLEGIAQASDQIAVSDPFLGVATVDTSGSAFYHGVFVGGQIDF